MRIMSRRPLAAALILMCATAVAGCSRKSAPSQSAAPANQVLVSAADVVRAETRRMEAGVTFTGALEPAEIVQVIARFEGDLESVLVREGQRVTKGQPLAVYAPRDVKDASTAAEADYLSAQAAFLAAQNAERRAQRLLDAGAAAPSDREAAGAQRAAAEAMLRAAEARRNRAREDSERLDVPSPIQGWVSHIYRHGGDRTLVGDPIVQVVDTRILELSATVPSEALARVQPGAPLRFRVGAFPGETFEGTVDRVNPTTEPGTRQVRVYARVPNDDGRLVGGLFVSGRVVDSIREQAVAAPMAALRSEGTEKVVYRLSRGIARRIRVTTGLFDDETGFVELMGDVNAGDSLLTGVLAGLKDGAPARVLTGTNGNGATAATNAAGASPSAGEK